MIPSRPPNCAASASSIERLTRERNKLKAERRERIATAALQGVMANSSRRGPPWEAAKIAIEVADELILQLDKGPRP